MVTDGSNRRSLSRRRVLATTGATLGGALVAGAAAGQEGTTGADDGTGTESPPEEQATHRGVILESEEWEVDELEGYFLHVSGGVNPENAEVADQCDYSDWSESTQAFDVALIPPGNADRQEANTLYLPGDVSVDSGDIFSIESIQRCASGYLGVQAQLIGNREVGPGGRNVQVGGQADETPTPEGGVNRPGDGGAGDGGDGGGTGGDGGGDGGTAANGPGFGIVAGIAGLLGAGALAEWRRNRE